MFSKDPKRRTQAMSFVKNFYFSVDELMDGEFLRSSHVVTYNMLASPNFVLYLDQGYEFTEYSPYDSVVDGKKRIFLVKGFNQYRKILLREDYISIDYSAIKNPFYRELAWRSTTSTKGRLYRSSFACTLRLFLPALFKLKRSDGYYTPQLGIFTVWDAFFMYAFFEHNSNSITTFNHWMMDIRDFLNWADESKAIVVEKASLMVLKNKKKPTLPTNTPVLPDEHVTKLSEAVIQRGKEDSTWTQVLILLHLSLFTPLRIGQSCSLLRNELQYEAAYDSFSVVSSNKGTRGNMGQIVLGGIVTDLIKKALGINDKVGLGCTDEYLREQVFLYECNSKYYVFNSRKFNAMLTEVCTACGLPKYTSKNLRATYMTKAYIEACRSGAKKDYLLKLYSYHKHAGTTLENYVNHEEALANLSEELKKEQDWKRTMCPDEIQALDNVIVEYQTLIAEAPTKESRLQLENELKDYQTKRDELISA